MDKKNNFFSRASSNNLNNVSDDSRENDSEDENDFYTWNNSSSQRRPSVPQSHVSNNVNNQQSENANIQSQPPTVYLHILGVATNGVIGIRESYNITHNLDLLRRIEEQSSIFRRFGLNIEQLDDVPELVPFVEMSQNLYEPPQSHVTVPDVINTYRTVNPIPHTRSSIPRHRAMHGHYNPQPHNLIPQVLSTILTFPAQIPAQNSPQRNYALPSMFYQLSAFPRYSSRSRTNFANRTGPMEQINLQIGNDYDPNSFSRRMAQVVNFTPRRQNYEYRSSSYLQELRELNELIYGTNNQFLPNNTQGANVNNANIEITQSLEVNTRNNIETKEYKAENQGNAGDNIENTEVNTVNAKNNTENDADNTENAKNNTENDADNTQNDADNTENAEDNTENAEDNTENAEDNTENAEDNTENAEDNTDISDLIFYLL